jgi:hypothetical protein
LYLLLICQHFIKAALRGGFLLPPPQDFEPSDRDKCPF